VRGIRVSNVVARGAQRAVWLRGLPERPLEDVTLRGIRLEASEGIYAKDVRQVVIDGADLRVTEGIGVRLRRVAEFAGTGIRGEGVPAGDAPWAELVDVRGARLRGWRVPAVGTFLRLVGSETAGIGLVENEVSAARQQIEYADGATEAALGPRE
jgi:hypothetical protein